MFIEVKEEAQVFASILALISEHISDEKFEQFKTTSEVLFSERGIRPLSEEEMVDTIIKQVLKPLNKKLGPMAKEYAKLIEQSGNSLNPTGNPFAQLDNV